MGANFPYTFGSQSEPYIFGWRGGITVGTSYLPETVAFLTANGTPNNSSLTVYGITGAQMWNAVDLYFGTLINQGRWAKLEMFHLYITGTASGNKFNALNPIDSDAAFRLTFNGGVTHGLGMTGNGTNGWAETHFNLLNDSVHYQQNNASCGFYCISNEVGAYVDMSILTSLQGVSMMTGRGASTDRMVINSSDYSILATTDALGMISLVREDASATRRYRNITAINTVSRTSTPLPNDTMAYMTLKRTGSANANYSPRTYLMNYAGAGMTALEHADFYTPTQAFFTTLGVAV